MRWLLACAATCAACKAKHAAQHDIEPNTVSFGSGAPRDAAAPIDAGVWPELATLPHVEPVRVISIATKPDVPRFTVGGPTLLGDLALVSSSQFGFTAIDFRRGQLVWNKPAGTHVAPPIAVDGNAVLVGSCVNPPTIPDGQTLLGCMRVVSPTGTDLAYLAIRGTGLDDFNASAGDQRLWLDHGAMVWRRGDAAVSIDPLTGVAKTVKADDPPLVIHYKNKSWDIRRTQDGVIEATGTPSWRTDRSYSALLGGVYIPGQSPLVRVAGLSSRTGVPEIMIFDIDATGSLNSQVSLGPVPGIAATASAIDSVGNVALVVRLDSSLQRDFIAGYATNAALIWTYPLPQTARPDPIGIAIANDAVVVFHDGDTVTVLPELSAPPTAPGAVRAPSENTTP